MTREDIKKLLNKNTHNPHRVYIDLSNNEMSLESGFKIIMYSPFPFRTVEERISIIRDIIDNNRQFYYSENGVPKGAKYICDVGICDAGQLYAK